MVEDVVTDDQQVARERQLRRSRQFLHQLTSGMAGWLTFEQMQNGLDNLREAELAKPLECVARGRGFEVYGEFQLPKLPKKRGAPPRIDFLLVHRKQKIAIALETKYKKNGRKMPGSFGADAKRLHGLTLESLNRQIVNGVAPPIVEPIDGYGLFRALIIVWHETDVMDQMQLEPAVIVRQFVDLVRALVPEGGEVSTRNLSKALLGVMPTRAVARTTGALRPGSTHTYKRFWVACLFEQRAWSKL